MAAKSTPPKSRRGDASRSVKRRWFRVDRVCMIIETTGNPLRCGGSAPVSRHQVTAVRPEAGKKTAMRLVPRTGLFGIVLVAVVVMLGGCGGGSNSAARKLHAVLAA